MESGLAARNGGRAGLVALVAILLLGLGLRVGYAWDGRAPVYDAQAYAAIATNLDRGEGFTVGPAATQPSSNYSPGLPLAVAAVYEATGGVHERAARVVLALVASLAVWFAYLIGRRLGRPLARPPRAGVVGERGGVAEGICNRHGVAAGLLAALAVAIYPAFLEYGGMLMSESLAATLLAGGVLALLWARDASMRGGTAWARWLTAGLALGALAMVRPEYLAVGVLLAVVVAISEVRLSFSADSAGRNSRAWPGWRGIVCGALVLAGIAVVVAPWTVRNAVALERFVPISTGGGQVLYAGTYLPSDGDPEKVGAGVVAENPDIFSPADATRLRLEQILARLAAHTYPELESDEALSKMGREQLWDDVSEEPLEYAGFVATKVGRIWSHGPRDVMREPLWEALHWALVGFGLLGLALLAWRRRWEALVLATVFLSITAISALLVASPRRVLVMIPLVAALAGFGAVWLWGQRFRLFRAHSPQKVESGETVGSPG
jgi:4-amino-4-deoxy-L-arabinose transferase-like glycosyltransferase